MAAAPPQVTPTGKHLKHERKPRSTNEIRPLFFSVAGFQEFSKFRIERSFHSSLVLFCFKDLTAESGAFCGQLGFKWPSPSPASSVQTMQEARSFIAKQEALVKESKQDCYSKMWSELGPSSEKRMEQCMSTVTNAHEANLCVCTMYTEYATTASQWAATCPLAGRMLQDPGKKHTRPRAHGQQ